MPDDVPQPNYRNHIFFLLGPLLVSILLLEATLWYSLHNNRNALLADTSLNHVIHIVAMHTTNGTQVGQRMCSRDHCIRNMIHMKNVNGKSLERSRQISNKAILLKYSA